MIEYDLLRLFEHPLRFRICIPSTIVTFAGTNANQCEINVRWRSSAIADEQEENLRLYWDLSTIKQFYGEVEEDIDIIRERDEDRATQVELAAVVVAVAVMSKIEPNTRFTRRSGTGTGHDFYLNDTRDEMIEVAGRWQGGLPGLFEEKRSQSNSNPHLPMRWVSVTIVTETPRNRSEGLHP